MLFSDVTDDAQLPGGVRWDIATATSTDLVHWSSPLPWPAQRGVIGVVSPDVVAQPDGHLRRHLRLGPRGGGRRGAEALLPDVGELETWSAPHPLARTLGPRPRRPHDRSGTGLGPATGSSWATKRAPALSISEIAWSRSGSVAGPWVSVGKPDISLYKDTVENYEFLTMGGRWHLVATSKPSTSHGCSLSQVNPPGRRPLWLHLDRSHRARYPLSDVELRTGVSSVNYEHANSVFLCDARSADGYYYATTPAVTSSPSSTAGVMRASASP